jgi:hypothetical protein
VAEGDKAGVEDENQIPSPHGIVKTTKIDKAPEVILKKNGKICHILTATGS